MKPNNKKKSEKKKTHQVQFYPSVHAIGKARAKSMGLSFQEYVSFLDPRRCRRGLVMKKKCNHCKKDTGGFKYCNESCEIQGLKKEKKDLDKQLFTQDSDYNDMLIALKEEHKKELEEAKQNIYKYAKIAIMNGEDEFGFSWEDFKYFLLDEELKEKGDE